MKWKHEKRVELNRIAHATVVFLMIVIGCAGSRNVVPSSIEADQAPAFIDSHHEDFQAYYSGSGDAPAAVLLDIKSDEIHLAENGWQPIEDRATLNAKVDAMRANYRYWGIAAQGPQLSVIRSEEGETIGYLYSPLLYTPVARSGPEEYRVFPVSDSEVKRRGDPGIKGAGG